MPENLAPSSAYTPEKFTDRIEEIDQIKELLTKEHSPVRTLEISGDRGAGKTWLSLHLHRTYFKQELRGVQSWLFSLWSPANDYRPQGQVRSVNEYFFDGGEKLKIDEFLQMFVNNLELSLPPNAATVEKVDIIRRHIEDHGDQRFVLILDSAYESDWGLLEELENKFLGIMLTLDNFYIIVTGRGRPYPWKIPQLIDAVRFGLGKFSVEKLTEQLQKFDLHASLSIQEIYAIGDGWPLFTEYLACAQDEREALGMAETILFSAVPRKDIDQIRSYFEALSVLDGFGEKEAALLVGVYQNNTKQDGREICDLMSNTRLASWKNGRYEMNEPVKNILRQYLPLVNKPAWAELQRAAYRHFASLAADEKARRFWPFFETQKKNHAIALETAGMPLQVHNQPG